MGCVPIVLNTSIARLYSGQPILVVNDWNEVTVERLVEFERNSAMLNKINGIVQTEIVKAEYWKKKINDCKIGFF